MSRGRRRPDVLSFSCPTCGARVGEYCSTGRDAPHARRERLVPVVGKQPVKSVQAIPTAVESNRRRH